MVDHKAQSVLLAIEITRLKRELSEAQEIQEIVKPEQTEP